MTMRNHELHLKGKSTQISVYYNSLNCSQKEKARSDHLLVYLSSKDFLGLHGTKNSRQGLVKFNFVDVNQMMISKKPNENIRQNLLEYYGLKKIDGEVCLPQIVLNEYKLKKKPIQTLKRIKQGSNSAAPSPREDYGLIGSQKGGFSEASEISTPRSKKIGLPSQQSTNCFKRRSSFQEGQGEKFAEAKRIWICDYKSSVYLMDCKIFKDVLLEKRCPHYRLYKRVPIYSYTKGNENDLATSQCSTCYLAKNPSSRYNLVVIGHFMRNDCRELHEICTALEENKVYYHRIDKDNLNSQSDVNFIKKAHKIETKYFPNEEPDFSIYLFGLKISPETIQSALLPNGNLLQSIISKHRCTFCFKQCQKRRSGREGRGKKDSLPICKACVAKGLHKCDGRYYTAEVACSVVSKILSKQVAKPKNTSSKVPWIIRDFSTQKKAPLSCRHLGTPNTGRLPHSTTEDLDSENVNLIKIDKKKMHFEFPG
ncbi:unnamed protein product [Moneuplotes crassus]|uniref:Uncharacterized protein n=1 Tax=Euplotes crassus TaxID=5936 RepID=A0AAD1XD10_EUPCR|nr:unnamed protein product [Moneuplotes crassus]